MINRDKQSKTRQPTIRFYLLTAFALLILWGVPDHVLAQTQWTTAPNGTDIYNTTSGNVGIGTTPIPGYRLHIAGNNTATGGYPLIKLQNTQPGGHSYWLYSGASSVASDFSIYNETTGMMPILIKGSNGNVGIGMTTNGPGYKLDVNGTFNATAIYQNGSPFISSQWTTGTDNISYSSGNVGIGTTGPGNKLEVKGGTGTSSINIDGIAVSTTNTTYTTKGRLSSNFDTLYLNQNAYFNGSEWVADNTFRASAGIALTTSNANSRIAFHTNSTNNNGLGYERMRIDKDGNVGIGTTTPGYKLDVNGIINATAIYQNGLPFSTSQWTTGTDNVSYNSGNVGIGTTAPTRRLTVFDSDANGATLSLKTESSGLGTMDGFDLQFGSSNAFIWNRENGAMMFGTNNTERLRITDVGNVGIGIAVPTAKLDVGGQVRSSVGGFKFPDGTVQTTAAVSGGGTITGVSASTGLSGGGTSGSVTLTNADRGSSQSIFKNIANAAGATQFSAGSNNDSLRFEGSGGTSVTFDAANKKVVINSSTSGSTLSAANVSAGEFGQNTGGGNFSFPGNVTVTGNLAAKYQDIAEWVPANRALSAGTVVVLNPTQSNQVMASTQAYDTRVAGVISERPGLILGEAGKDKVLVATTGRVKVKVDATRAPVKVGDLLVTSDKQGVAMKSEPLMIQGRQFHSPGTLIGKALEPLEQGTGEILVLLSLH